MTAGAVASRGCDSLVGEGGRGIGVELDGRREPERTVAHDPQPDTELEVVGRGLEPAVAQRDDLGADPLDPHLGVLAAERLGSLERGGPYRLERKR